MKNNSLNYNKIGVIGAGVIGSSVAHLFAQAGLHVVLIDQNEEILKNSRNSIEKNARLYDVVKTSGVTPDEVLSHIHCNISLDSLSDVEFVIENITEDWEVKKVCHEKISQIIPVDAPVAVNTSAIPITRISSIHSNPERVVGMHFMNPVPVMPVVELIRGVHSSDAALDEAKKLVKQAGKHSILINDSPGFVTNRVMMQMVNEAMFLVHEGVATPLDVDRLFKTCFGHKMGPLATADMIGLDTVLKSIEVIQKEFNDSKYRPCPLLMQKVYAGHLGRKSGQGFFTYDSL